VNLPLAEILGANVFEKCTGLTTVSLGAAAPRLGPSMLHGVNEAKAVTVLVPSGTEAYGTIPATFTGPDDAETWGNGFRGGGWDGITLDRTDRINTYITLTIQNEAGE
jgi:hypothetical protein